MLKFRILISLVSVIVGCTLSGAVLAQDSFYKDKRITMVVGFNPGGGYDSYARTVARYWANHIPGKPKFIVQNMPGAGSLTAAKHLAKIAAKDGTVLGAVNPNLASSLLLRPRRAKLDLRRFNWIGSPARLTVVAVVWHTAPVQNLKALKTAEMIIGGSGGATVLLPTAAQKILGLKFKVISGYRGTRGSMMAMERGEIQAAGISYSRFKAGYTDWVTKGKAKIFVQFGLTTHPELPKVPKLIDLAKSDQQRQALRFLLTYQEMGRPIVAPPGVSAKRVALLRKAFNATMKDPKFIQGAKKQRLAVATDFPKGEDLQKLVAQIYMTPKAVLSYLKEKKLHRKKRRKKKKKKKSG